MSRVFTNTIAGALLATTALAAPAFAQDYGTTTVGKAKISAGVGVTTMSLPDVNFSPLFNVNIGATNATITTVDRLENNDLDTDYGYAFNAGIEVPLQGAWRNKSISVEGFYGNVDNDDSISCSSNAALTSVCGWNNIVNSGPAVFDQVFADRVFFHTDREVHNYGGSAEVRHYFGGPVPVETYKGTYKGSYKDGPPPAPVSSGRFIDPTYIGVGFDFRAIDQDVDITGITSGFAFPGPATLNYDEELDTKYYGAIAAIGGTYHLPIFSGITDGLGLESSFRLWGGIYYADTDYDGRFQQTSIPGFNNTSSLSLDDDDVAFVGGLRLETGKHLTARTKISLRSDYEYYSHVPQVRYNDLSTFTVAGPGGGIVTGTGPNNGTSLDDDDAFISRTTLRLTIALGPDEIMPAAYK